MITVFLVDASADEAAVGDVHLDYEISAQDMPAIAGETVVTEAKLNEIILAG